MNVRLADMETDALALMDAARDFVSRMDFTAFLPETDAEFVAAVARLMTLPAVEVTVAVDGGRVVGAIGMIYGPCLWNLDAVVADEAFWWAAADAPKTAALRLLRFTLQRVAARGAVANFKCLTSSPAGVDRVYRRLGLRPVETSYMGVAG